MPGPRSFWLFGLGNSDYCGWTGDRLGSLHLLWVGSKLVAEGFTDLMDRVEEAEVATIVATTNRLRHDDWYDLHRLRWYPVGELRHIDFHPVVPAEMTVVNACHA